jgi:hypothetical protein
MHESKVKILTKPEKARTFEWEPMEGFNLVHR